MTSAAQTTGKTKEKYLSLAQNLLHWCVRFSVSLLMIGFAVRLLFTPLYLEIIYRFPWFPPDQYGFSLEDRLYYSQKTRRFILSGPSFFSSDNNNTFTFRDSTKPFYTLSEKKHLEDVKIIWHRIVLLSQISLWLLVISSVVVSLLKSFDYLVNLYRQTLKVLPFIPASLVLPGLLLWNHFFEVFHRLLFSPGTYSFSANSSLIRLFPNQFWVTAFSVLILLLIIVCLILYRILGIIMVTLSPRKAPSSNQKYG